MRCDGKPARKVQASLQSDSNVNCLDLHSEKGEKLRNESETPRSEGGGQSAGTHTRTDEHFVEENVNAGVDSLGE